MKWQKFIYFVSKNIHAIMSVTNQIFKDKKESICKINIQQK